MKNMQFIITTTPCDLGRGIKVEIEINDMGFSCGTKATIYRRFTGGKESSRYQAATYIRKMRKLWNDGILLDILEGYN